MGKAHVDLRSVTTVALDLAKNVFQSSRRGRGRQDCDHHRVKAQGCVLFLGSLRPASQV